MYVLQRKSHLCIPFLGIVRLQSQCPYSCVCERFIFPRIGPHISCSRIGRSILGMYKSLTDTWMWKLGLWPRNSSSGNMCFEFSVLVLCSVGERVLVTEVTECQTERVKKAYFNDAAYLSAFVCSMAPNVHNKKTQKLKNFRVVPLENTHFTFIFFFCVNLYWISLNTMHMFPIYHP
jgi:hypothetical protein